jgi:hypothetical protein
VPAEELEGKAERKNVPKKGKQQDHTVRRLPGPADDGLGDEGSFRTPFGLFGTGREHKLNLLQQLFGA